MGRDRGKGEKREADGKIRGGKTSGVQGDDGGRESSGVAHESPGVEEEEGGRKASVVAENPGGGPGSG